MDVIITFLCLSKMGNEEKAKCGSQNYCKPQPDFILFPRQGSDPRIPERELHLFCSVHVSQIPSNWIEFSSRVFQESLAIKVPSLLMQDHSPIKVQIVHNFKDIKGHFLAVSLQWQDILLHLKHLMGQTTMRVFLTSGL